MDKALHNSDTMIGARIRDRRLKAGLKQGELADRIGISPSYLNLIEHNRRRIGGKMIVSLASVLGVDPQVFSQGAQADLVRRVQDATREDASRELLGEDAGREAQLVEHFPGWARVIGAQQDRISQLETLIDGLNDRLTHDPVLSERMHDVLSTVSAIRSTASILVGTPDLDAEWQGRFHNNIDTESRRLAESAAGMVEHFEHLNQSTARYVTPLEATQTLFEKHNNHFPTLEVDGAQAIDPVLNEAGLTAGAAYEMSRHALLKYVETAQALPLEKLEAAILDQEGQVDPSALAAHFGLSIEAIIMRLAQLPHMSGVPEIGAVQCDSAGALLMRKPVEGFPIPRFGAACALWPIFTALSHPHTPIKMTLRTSEEATFTCYAIAQAKRSNSFTLPPVFDRFMIMVADDPAVIDQNVGAACRVCPQKDCIARREPSIIDALAISKGNIDEF